MKIGKCASSICRILVFIILIAVISSLPSLWASFYEQRKKFGAYSVSMWMDEDDGESHLVITKNGKKIFEEIEIGSHYYFGNNFDPNLKKDVYSGKNVTGNGIVNLLVSKWTGGAHCCNFLYIFELGDTFRHVETVAANSNIILLRNLDSDSIKEIEFWDGAIDYQFASFAFSPSGRVVLKYVKDRYEVSYKLMSRPTFSSRSLVKLKKKIRRDFLKKDTPDLPFELLKLMMDLSYSGRVNVALNIADQTWPPWKPGLDQFKKEFTEALASSPYWPKLGNSKY